MVKLIFRTLKLPTAKWPWLDRVSAAWLCLVSAMLLGILSLAAVGQIARQCEVDDGYLVDANGNRLGDANRNKLVTGDKEFECRTVLGEFKVTVPGWLAGVR